MRIAFVGTLGRESVNGVEYATYVLARHLVNYGHKIFFYYLGEESTSYNESSGIEYRVFGRSYSKLISPDELKFHIENNLDQIDIFHLHSVFIPLNYYVSQLLQRLGMPYVITPHGGYMKDALTNTLRSLRIPKMLYINFFEKRIIQEAKSLIATTPREIKDFRNFGYTGRVDLIPNPLPFENAVQERTRVDSQIRILYMGRYDIKFKGIDFLIETFHYLNSERKNLELVMYGAGRDEQRIIKLLEEKKISNAEINKPIYGEEKISMICNSDLYFQPSQWESFGMSILEAMGCGLPVVLTEGCYLSHLLKEQRVGLVVPDNPRKASSLILKYLDDRARYTTDGAKLQQIALDEFSADKVAQQTLELYEHVLMPQN